MTTTSTSDAQSLAREQHSAPHVPPDGPTPSQTIGPYFRIGMDGFEPTDLVAPGTPGAITISGRVIDGAGAPVSDASLEIWQADTDGAFPAAPTDDGPDSWTGERWHGWGRSMTDDDGAFTFTTVKPGPVGDGQAPHIDITVFCRGVLQRLVTRLYFPDEAAANGTDPVLAAAGDRAATLVAEAEGPGRLHHDIVLQGERETVFFVW
ncbi:MAG: protocatechuate 3,4-dioxygenase subunit alpha [Acidimicrobiaceae bacterium]|nr:protocatechuate 3,4-dioxygenase subunit alpha [Acidimicrobiaceae bacterium]